MTHFERLVGLPERTSDNGGRPGPAPSQLHRALALVATISLFIGTRAAWTDALTLSPTVMVVISVGYLTILGLAALSLVVRTQRALVVVDVLILVTAAVQVVGALILQHKPTDEGTLIAQAARSLLGGGEIYGVAWPQLFAQQHLPVTWMMGGGADYTLGYPPLAVLLTAAALLVFSFPAAASIVTTLILLIGAFALWRLLPIDWRPGATIVMLGFPFMPHYARLGFPAIIAMVWLIPVDRPLARHRPGRPASALRSAPGGVSRRGMRDAAAGMVRGAVPPGRLVRVASGEVPARRAFGTVASFAGVAGVTFLAINLPFIARDAPAWASGVALVLTQHAIPHGQGLIDVVVLPDRRQRRARLLLVRDPAVGSGHAGCHGDLDPPPGTCPDRDPVAGVLPVRSLAGRLLPADDAALARGGRDRARHRSSHTPGSHGSPRRRDRSGASRPADRAACRASRLARCSQRASSRRHSCAHRSPIASDEPLELAVVSTTWHGPHAQGLWQISVDVVNGSTVALAPHFTVSTGQGVTPFWNAVGGPAQLAPQTRSDLHS